MRSTRCMYYPYGWDAYHFSEDGMGYVEIMNACEDQQTSTASPGRLADMEATWVKIRTNRRSCAFSWEGQLLKDWRVKVVCFFKHCMHCVWANVGGAKAMDGYEDQRTITGILSISCIALARM